MLMHGKDNQTKRKLFKEFKKELLDRRIGNLIGAMRESLKRGKAV